WRSSLSRTVSLANQPDGFMQPYRKDTISASTSVARPVVIGIPSVSFSCSPRAHPEVILAQAGSRATRVGWTGVADSPSETPGESGEGLAGTEAVRTIGEHSASATIPISSHPGPN